MTLAPWIVEMLNHEPEGDRMKDNFAIAQRIHDRMESPDYYDDGPEEEIQDVPDCCITCTHKDIFHTGEAFYNRDDFQDEEVYCLIGIALPVVKRTCKRSKWK